MSYSGYWCEFQPIYDLHSERILGYESLLRGGEQNPLILIEDAIRNNTLHDLEFASHSLSVKQFAKDSRNDSTMLFVNFYPTTLLDKEYLLRFKNLIEKYTPTSRIVVEITEHEDVDIQSLQSGIKYLNSEGFRIAIDDFNTKHTLNYVETLHPDIIKLDKSLVQNYSQCKQKQVVELIEWSYNQGSILIAEGIETKEHLKQVLALGISYGQGWLLGPPSKAISVR